ncbi:MAG: S41 family peptidase, partial [Bacteroidales bacterium]|nr:S41 family peptidase [Bacteroidales bacterium]
MLEELDPYTVYVPEEEQEDFALMISKTYGGVGAIIHKTVGSNVIINEPYFDSPAYRAGLVCGDEVMEIDGESVTDLTASEASERMKGKPGTTVVFKVKKVRSGEIVDVPVTRQRIHLPDLEYVGMLDDTTGYILQTGFTENVSNAIRGAYYKLKEDGMTRLILDLRGNGGGLLDEACKIVSLFVPVGSVVVTSKGADPASYHEFKTATAPIDLEIPLIVLVDSGSASASEIVSGALQDLDRATIMGTRTFGKGLVQTVRPVAYNGQLKVTTAKYYTPSGRCVQAIDYSKRNEDGSVGYIPDSLTHEFTTLHGRTVRDGGGITPDVKLEGKKYSRLTYSLVYSGIIDQFVLEYVRRHDSIAPIEDYHLSDADYEEFIEFAKGQEFDYRSSAETMFDNMRKELEEDGFGEMLTDRLNALQEGIKIDKETFLRMKKEEIVPFVEEEIAVRYHYQEAGIQVRIRYDEQLHEALRSPLIGLETASLVRPASPQIMGEEVGEPPVETEE